MRGSLVYTAEGRLNTKLQRQRDISQNLEGKNSSVPESYRTNNSKEELCLEYVNNFVEQFSSIYKNRRMPYITAENEYGVRKLVCATLRPTLIPIPELYDMYECASFLAGYILYEPLDPQTEPPRYLFSPARTLESYTGDSFDMSTLLCSFLLGAGYDAYVVAGYAPSFITLKDQSRTPCPLLKESHDTLGAAHKGLLHTGPPVDDSPNSFLPPDNSVKSSKFLAEIAEKQRLAAVDTFQLWVDDPPLDEAHMMAEARAASAQEDLRVHAWVLVRAGRRDVRESVFIEASTGRVYSTRASPYLAVEAVWNHTNFHVNAHAPRACADLDFAFRSASSTGGEAGGEAGGGEGLGGRPPPSPGRPSPPHPPTAPTPAGGEAGGGGGGWEPLFLSRSDLLATTPGTLPGGGEDGDLMDTDGPTAEAGGGLGLGLGSGGGGGGGGALEAAGRLFDPPPAWSAPLALPRAAYLVKYPPHGQRSARFYCAKADFFSAHGPQPHRQAMAMRVTFYADRACTRVKEVHEWFEHRVDRLYKRVRVFLPTRQTRESYLPGSRGEVRRWVDFPGKRQEVDFYVSGRLDRLVRREEDMGVRVVEYFHQRSDCLVHRVVDLTTDRGTAGGGLASHPPATAAAAAAAAASVAHAQTPSAPPTATAATSAAALPSRTFTLPASESSSHLQPECYITRMVFGYEAPSALDADSARRGAEGKGKGKKDKDDHPHPHPHPHNNNNHNNNHNHHHHIARRVFHVREGKAVFHFHFARGQVTGRVQTLLHTRGPSVPLLSEQALAQEVGVDEDPDALQEAAACERESFSAVKAAFTLHQRLVEARVDGEQRVDVDKTVFDRALDRVEAASRDARAAIDPAAAKESRGADYLTPFLRNTADPAGLSREEAQAIRAACLDALKARLVERANIIQTKLHEENARLGKKQELFQRSQREGDFSTEEYEKYCTEAMFRIQILEQRLATHEETALRKFAELDLKLANDPRLKVLKN